MMISNIQSKDHIEEIPLDKFDNYIKMNDAIIFISSNK